MEIIYNKVFLEHDTGAHPESRKRLEALGQLPETRVENGEHYLELFHTKEYVNRIKAACEKGLRLDGDTITSRGTYNAAVHAVGAAVMASDSKGFAIVRPPGHHAHSSRFGGFCIFNNLGIAAERLARQGKRVLVLDFDGHCGDGTEDFFYERSDVMYWSLHQWPAYPGTGTVDQIGNGKGKGYTINVPLPPGTGDDIYLDAMGMFMPVAEQFNPDAVAVSAGFDGHQRETLLDLKLSVDTYYEIGRILRKFSNVFAVLEGGYNLEAFPKCVFNFLDGANGKPKQYSEEATDSRIITIEEFTEQAERLKLKLAAFWKI
jgi:acetoin utilization deacetylase AcuC-like enzyme